MLPSGLIIKQSYGKKMEFGGSKIFILPFSPYIYIYIYIYNVKCEIYVCMLF